MTDILKLLNAEVAREKKTPKRKVILTAVVEHRIDSNPPTGLVVGLHVVECSCGVSVQYPAGLFLERTDAKTRAVKYTATTKGEVVAGWKNLPRRISEISRTKVSGCLNCIPLKGEI